METMDSSGDNYADNVPDNALLLPHTGLRIDLRGVTPSTPPPEQRLGNSSPSTSQEFFSRKHAYAATLILGWYILSTAINIFNKWFFGASSYHYPYPIFVTSCHMLFHSIISFFVLAFIWPSWRPTKIMSVSDYFTKIVPCAASAGMDIALTNASLQFITLSFATMIKSAVPIAVLLFSFAFGLERPRPQLIVIICVIAAGSSLMVFGELKFHVVGFIEAFVATVSSGLRWTLTHLLLAKDELGIANPVATNLYLAPAMAICMLSVGLMIEGLPRMADKGPELFLYVFSSGFLAWGLVMFEYGW